MALQKPRNIYIIGAQSTGKTTIVNALQAIWEQEERQGNTTNGTSSSEHLANTSRVLETTPSQSPDGSWRNERDEVRKPRIIRELARTVLQNLNVTRDDLTSDPDSALTIQRHILNAQALAERTILENDGDSWFISDRSGVDPLVYATIFAADSALQKLVGSAEWLELETRMREGAVFVCEAGTKWLLDDGVRYMPASMEDWKEVDTFFRTILAQRSISYTVIPSTMIEIRDRVDLVLAKWRALCDGKVISEF